MAGKCLIRLLVQGLLACTACAQWVQYTCSDCTATCSSVCVAGQICEIDHNIGDHNSGIHRCKVTTPSSDEEESACLGQCAIKTSTTIAVFIAIWNLLLQAGLVIYARQRRQAKTLLAIGQRAVGRILKKTIAVTDSTYYLIEYSFPAGQRWVKTHDAGVAVNYKVFGPLTEHGEVDVLYYDPDPRICMLATEAHDKLIALVGARLFALVFVAATFGLNGWFIIRSVDEPAGANLIGVLVIYSFPLCIYLLGTIWQASIVLFPFAQIFCCCCADARVGKSMVDEDPAKDLAVIAPVASVAAPVAAAAVAQVMPEPVAQSVMQVTVPENAAPGQHLTVQAPSGQHLSMVVPAEAPPGTILLIGYGPAP